jgi:chromatin segregation and condensation protein Rec8/ScpA/Scc1 (kleisin family)
VERQEFDVGQKMDEIVALLGRHKEGLEFKAAFAKTGNGPEKVASFLAVLELLKLKVIRISHRLLLHQFIYSCVKERIAMLQDFKLGELEAVFLRQGNR